MLTVKGDITKLGTKVDAIVNSAHPTLGVGGGVCGAIHQAAGPGLAHECARFMRNAGHEEITNCQAVVTYPWNLGETVGMIVHVVVPALQSAYFTKRWKGKSAKKWAKPKPSLLDVAAMQTAYRNAALAAMREGAKTIAFPLMGAGSYCWDEEDALAVASEAIQQIENDWGMEATLVLYDPPPLRKFTKGEIEQCVSL